MQDICDLAKKLWRMYYMSKCEDCIEDLFPYIDEQCVVVGTGKHEYYQSKKELCEALLREEREGYFTKFKILNEWYQTQIISEDAILVYGEIHVVHEQENCPEANIDMATRFSVIFQQKEGMWKIMHVHHSMPNVEQQQGESYPRTLSEKLIETQELAKKLRNLVRKDPLTNLYSRPAFFEEGRKQLKKYKNCYCMLIDLDYFKSINDTYGHVKGDDVLRKAGKILERSIRKEDIASRIGGDEFAILCSDVDDKIICNIAERILQRYREEMKIMLGTDMGMSIGITKVSSSETMKDAYHKADLALYETKRRGRNGYSLYTKHVSK